MKIHSLCLLRCWTRRLTHNGGCVPEQHSESKQDTSISSVLIASNLVHLSANLDDLSIGYVSHKAVPENILESREAHVDKEHLQKASQLYGRLHDAPNSITFVSALEICEVGEQVLLLHHSMFDYGLESNMCIANSLINVYAYCWSLKEAIAEFEKLSTPSLITYNTVISHYVRHECDIEALHIYVEMCESGIKPNNNTYIGVLKACSNIRALEQGKLVLADIKRDELESCPFIKETVIDMYAKCGNLEDALQIFRELSDHNEEMWSAIIAGHVECGRCHDALDLYKEMEEEGIEPSGRTCIWALQACSDVAGIDVGRHIHACLVKRGLETVTAVGNVLVDLYAKCCKLEEAESVLYGISMRDGVSWSALIAGYAEHGDGPVALKHFNNMKGEDLKPDEASFLNIFHACCNSGLAQQGIAFFGSMIHDYRLMPSIDHYVCMVDFLGHKGLVTEAEDMVLLMSHVPDAVIWVAMLGMCAKHNDWEVGERAFARFLDCGSKIGAGYRLMAAIYAANMEWDKAEQVHKMIPG